ncbi:MAG: LCP family protein [Streptococcaceae bacterium]|nr:LCP family protein [Streptococcaceae bacterium]
MTFKKKIILIVLGILATASLTATVFGMKVLNDAENSFNKTFQPLKGKSADHSHVDATQPFSVLLLGIDTGDVGRTEKWVGRSDSMMVVTVNPVKKQTTVLSLDRDVLTHLVDIPESLDGTILPNPDKMNHAYAYGGVEASVATISALVGIKIDYYAAVNMEGLADLVNAVGGVTVDNKYSAAMPNEYPKEVPTAEEGKGFVVSDGSKGRTFVPYGKHLLNGETALAYARMRHQDPEGDIGRQKRQREVVQLIVKKLLSVDSVGNYQKIFDASSKNLKTDLPFEQLMKIAEGYSNAMDHVEMMQLQGIEANIPGGYYQLVPKAELLQAQNILKEQMGLPTSETIEDPETVTYESFTGNPAPEEIDPVISGGTSSSSHGSSTTQSSTDSTDTSSENAE